MMAHGLNRISVDPTICHGKPCVKGSRVMVAQVLDLVEDGKTFEQIIRNSFPSLTVTDLQACIHFAKALVTNAVPRAQPRRT